tara:strand:- start:47 stop:739 length:693 start_codon:yes stop_codon:yes gene_type:complete
MENLLYFRKLRPIASQSFTITSTNVSNWANIDQGSATSFMTLTGLGGDDIDSDTEFTSVTVKAVGSNSNVGTNISGGAVVANEVTTLDLGDVVDVTDSKLRIEPASGSGSGANIDAANGYTLVAGDIVTVNFAAFGLESAVAIPSARLISVNAVDDTHTNLAFASIKGTDNDDLLSITHDAGKFDVLARGINDAINADKKGIKVIADLQNSKFCANAGITEVVWSMVAGY